MVFLPQNNIGDEDDDSNNGYVNDNDNNNNNANDNNIKSDEILQYYYYNNDNIITIIVDIIIIIFIIIIIIIIIHLLGGQSSLVIDDHQVVVVLIHTTYRQWRIERVYSLRRRRHDRGHQFYWKKEMLIYMATYWKRGCGELSRRLLTSFYPQRFPFLSFLVFCLLSFSFCSPLYFVWKIE